MKNNGRLYKTFVDDDLKNAKFSLSKSYYYINEEGERCKLKELHLGNESNDRLFQLEDEESEWDYNKQSIYLNVKITIKNVKAFFEAEKACMLDTVLGVGLIWKPDCSRIKKCIKLITISNSDESIEHEIKDIRIDNLTSNTDFSLAIYIISPSKKSIPPFIGNQQGVILYEKKDWTIIMQGSGSIFPIQYISDESGPLWGITKYDYDDIDEADFSLDNLSININTLHPAYEFLYPKSQSYNKYFLNEVIGSAMALLIMELRNNMPDKQFDLNVPVLNKGTILQALVYFNQKLSFKVNDEYNILLMSIKKYLDTIEVK